MARKIKFALKMKDGTEVRDIDGLREHFDLETMLDYFANGKLQTWLEDRYYEEELDAIDELSEDDSNFNEKLCRILGVKYEELLSPEEIERRQQRLAKLKQYTSDPEILNKVNLVAFDQEDLADLLDEGQSVIYLCQNKFVIPLRQKNKKYIGIGDVEVVIKRKKLVDFEELNIHFENVAFDSEYKQLINSATLTMLNDEPAPSEVNDSDDDESYDNNAEINQYIKSANNGNPKAISKLCQLYYQDVNYAEAIKWCKKAVEYRDSQAANILGHIYREDSEVADDSKAIAWFEKSLEFDEDNVDSLRDIGDLFRELGSDDAYKQAIKFFKQAADKNDAYSMNEIGEMYWFGEGVEEDLDTAINWFKRAINTNNYTIAIGNLDCIYHYRMGKYYEAFDCDQQVLDKDPAIAHSLYNLGWLYYTGNEAPLDTTKDVLRAIQYFERENPELPLKDCIVIQCFEIAAYNGSVAAMETLGHIYHKECHHYHAMYWYLQVANHNNAASMYTIGTFFEYGQYVKLDEKKALIWYIKSAKAGNEDGKQKVDEKRSWFECYADKRNPDDLKILGDLSYVYSDYDSAMYWYQKAADKRNLEAIEEIATMYRYGIGVEKDLDKADEWDMKALELY